MLAIVRKRINLMKCIPAKAAYMILKVMLKNSWKINYDFRNSVIIFCVGQLSAECFI